MISSSVSVKGSSFSLQVGDNLVFNTYGFPLFHSLICTIISFTCACAKRYLTWLSTPSRKGPFNRRGRLLNFWSFRGRCVYSRGCLKEAGGVHSKHYGICLFNSESDADKFYELLKKQHPNIKFTFEKQQTNQISFIDIIIKNNAENFSTTIFGKKKQLLAYLLII